MSVQRQWTIWLVGGASGALVGGIVIYLLRYYWNVGVIESIACLLLFMFLGDWLLAWQNHRAEKAGVLRFWNRPTAETAVVVRDFAPAPDGRYRGKVGFHGEVWSAVGVAPLRENDRVRIRHRRRLELEVERMD